MMTSVYKKLPEKDYGITCYCFSKNECKSLWLIPYRNLEIMLACLFFTTARKKTYPLLYAIFSAFKDIQMMISIVKCTTQQIKTPVSLKITCRFRNCSSFIQSKGFFAWARDSEEGQPSAFIKANPYSGETRNSRSPMLTLPGKDSKKGRLLVLTTVRKRLMFSVTNLSPKLCRLGKKKFYRDVNVIWIF